MADKGYIAVWLDPTKDKDKAYIAVSERYPGFQIQFLNPRHFESPNSVGVDHRKVRGHVLATDDDRVYQAYVDESVEFVDMREIPERTRKEPECVVIYTKAQANEWNDACRAVARSTFPGLIVRPVQVAKYSGPIAGNVVAVVVPDDEVKIFDDYSAMHKQVLRVPEPNPKAGDGVALDATIDAGVLSATLQLPPANLRAVVHAQSDLVWLRALADTEAAGEDRRDVHEVINARLADIGSDNPHYVVGAKDGAESAGESEGDVASEPEGHSSPEGPKADGEPVPPSHGMAYIATLSARKIGEALQSIDDAETLEAMLASERTGKGRDSVIALIARRIRATG